MGGVEIYALRDPDSGEIRYIGKANNAAKRLTSHIRDSRVRDNPVHRWIRKLDRSGKRPSLTVECVATGDWKDLERQLIAQHRTDGTRLLNVADGGDEPYCPPDVLASNAALLNARLESDVSFRVIRKVLCASGMLLKQIEKSGSQERIAKAKAALARFRAAAASKPDVVAALLVSKGLVKV